MKKYFLLLLPILALTSCNNSYMDDFYGYYFDTFTSIRLYEGNKNNILDIDNIFAEVDEHSDNYLTKNDLYQLNNSGEEVTISSTLYDLIDCSLKMVPITNGYFQPLVGSLSKKWKESLDNEVILSSEIIEEELNKIAHSSIELKEDNKALKVGDATLDFGAIAKGYSLDLIKDYLDQNEINQYLIDAGSSSLLFGEKPTKDGLFNVTLNIPGLESKYYIQTKNCFLGASGVSEQGVEIDGITYSHIVNPFNGSVINNYDFTLVLANNGALSDVLATTFMMLDISDIQKIEQEQNVSVLIYKEKKQIYKSANIEVKQW